jgi:hypothetical protein
MEAQPVQGNSGLIIPSAFHSSETGELFTNCNVCDKNLLIPGTHYVIEKAVTHYPQYNANDTIFEYALCYDCYQTVLNAMSDTSKNNIQIYFLDNMQHVQQRLMNFMQGKSQIEDLISSCAIKGTPREALNEYQIACHCNGKNLDSSYPPLMIGHEAMDEMMQLLSSKTLGEIDRFYHDIIDIPPEFKEILNDRPVFIL